MSHDGHNEQVAMQGNTFVLDTYIDVLMVLALGIYTFRHPVAGFFYTFSLLFTVVNIVFWIMARMHLGNSTSIEPKVLVKTGIYSKLRHPMYVFSTLALLGMAYYMNSLMAYGLLAIFVLLEIEKIRKEDDALEKKFGAEFVAYKETTWF